MSIHFLIGKKIGMTRIFDDLGSDYPVTVLQGGPCAITQIKNIDGRTSVQVGFEDKADRHLNKPEKGHFEKSGVAPKRFLKEFNTSNIDGVGIGDNFGVDVFELGDLVTVSKVLKKNIWKISEVNISYKGRTFKEGKKISWIDGFRALLVILKEIGRAHV